MKIRVEWLSTGGMTVNAILAPTRTSLTSDMTPFIAPETINKEQNHNNKANRKSGNGGP